MFNLSVCLLILRSRMILPNQHFRLPVVISYNKILGLINFF